MISLTGDTLEHYRKVPLTIIFKSPACDNCDTLSATNDAVLGKFYPDKNYGDIEEIHLYTWTYGSTLAINRVAITFDLEKLPANAVIDSAFLSLYFNYPSQYLQLTPNGHEGKNSFVIQNFTSAWDESSITWNTQPAVSDAEVIVPNFENLKQGYVDINVTDLFKDMSILEHQGFLLKHYVEQPYKMTLLASKEHPKVYYHIPIP